MKIMNSTTKRNHPAFFCLQTLLLPLLAGCVLFLLLACRNEPEFGPTKRPPPPPNPAPTCTNAMAYRKSVSDPSICPTGPLYESCWALLALDQSPAAWDAKHQQTWGVTTDLCAWAGVTCSVDKTSVTALDLRGQSLKSIPPGIWTAFPQLTHLLLAQNDLIMLSNDTFCGLASLQSLDLSHNPLSPLSEILFAGLSKLQILTLNNDRIGSLPLHIFTGLSSLQVLDLSNNALQGFPAGLFLGLSQLQALFLDHNQLTETMNVLPSHAFMELSSLLHLGLSYNLFTTLPADVFAGLAKVTQVDLNDNRLAMVPMNLFESLPALTSLYLSRNAWNAGFSLSSATCTKMGLYIDNWSMMCP